MLAQQFRRNAQVDAERNFSDRCSSVIGFDTWPSGTTGRGIRLVSLWALQSAYWKVDLITTATYAVVGTLRDVHDAVDDADPSTADLLHQTIDGLEKLAWLIKSENRKV